jgi:UPF0755 protein
VTKLLANVDGFSSMTRKRPNIAARSLVKFSLAIFLVVGLWLYGLTLPVGKGETTEFTVQKGESTAVIASNLKITGLIRSPLMFRIIVKQAGLAGKLQAGFFELAPSMTTHEVALALTKGMTKSQKLTIPEGYRLEQIAETAGFPTKEFLQVAKGMEGQLFPDTYFLKEGITASELVKLMHDNFQNKVGSIDQKTLILASLIERETRGDDEKSVVAGILTKRLDAGWPLELDATVQYVRGKSGDWWPNTTLLDRKSPSPYNTYLQKGLPPAPIGNPGLDAINAARAPKTSPYWFYLHDKSGKIHYGATLDEHNANVRTYIQ